MSLLCLYIKLKHIVSYVSFHNGEQETVFEFFVHW